MQHEHPEPDKKPDDPPADAPGHAPKPDDGGHGGPPPHNREALIYRDDA